MIQIFWIFVIIAVAIALIGGFLKFLRVSASDKLIRIGTDVIVGIIISLDILIILAMFNITGIDMKGLLAFVFLMLTFIGFYRSSGPGVIYVITIFVMVFGYMFTGPYSGYIKTYTKGITAPLDAGIASAKMAAHDLFLLITNPQEYIAEKQMKTVHSEESTSYPMGIEFTDISTSPDSVFNGRRFYVQAYLENKGGLEANDLSLYAECGDKCYEDSEATVKYNENQQIEKYWKHVYTLGPFVSSLTDEKQFGTTADVTVHMSYKYSTASSLLVNVMDESEINRRLREGTLSFKLGIPVGKISPAMLVLSVGRQPVYAGDRIYLLISIVNKHPDSEVTLLPGITKLVVKVPKDLFSVSSCDVDTDYVNYTKTEIQNYTIIRFKFKRTIEIAPPNKENSDTKPFYYFTCDVTAKNVDISKEGEIYGYLANFSVDTEKVVGPVVMRSSHLDPNPFSGVCVSNIDGAVEKEKCGCTGSGCKDDDTLPSDCKNNGGSFSSWSLKDSLCLEGDSGLLGIVCCKRPAGKTKFLGGHYLGQCVKVNLKTVANNLSQEVKNIKYIWIRMDAESHAHCNDDVDIYGCYKSHCDPNDWKVIKNNTDGSGPKIIRISHDDLDKYGGISSLTAIDICTDPDKGSSCDHKIDWISVLFNSTS